MTFNSSTYSSQVPRWLLSKELPIPVGLWKTMTMGKELAGSGDADRILFPVLGYSYTDMLARP